MPNNLDRRLIEIPETHVAVLRGIAEMNLPTFQSVLKKTQDPITLKCVEVCTMILDQTRNQ